MPPRQTMTVYQLLRQLLIHALRGCGSGPVNLIVSGAGDSTGHRPMLFAAATDAAWESDGKGSYTLIGYDAE